MNTDESAIQVSEQVLQEACDWFMEFNEVEPDASASEHFNRWLRRSPEHVRAYLEIAAAWEESSHLEGTKRVDPISLVAEALAANNVIPLHPSANDSDTAGISTDMAAPPGRPVLARDKELSAPLPQRARRRSGRKVFAWLSSALAASVLVAVGMGFLIQDTTYSTGIGERRSILLDDGSTVELDARSRLRVRFSHAERTVYLVDGQALFQVKKDLARPFTVLSNETRVRAVGTQFDVYRKTTRTTITVVEGRVTVTTAQASMLPSNSAGTRSGENSEARFFLSAGEQLTVAPRTIPHAVRADLATATAWTQGKLIFDGTPLSDVVSEFNRYNGRQMIIEDASLAEYHIRGTFDAGDPDRLIQFLRDRFESDVRERGNEIRISRK